MVIDAVTLAGLDGEAAAQARAYASAEGITVADFLDAQKAQLGARRSHQKATASWSTSEETLVRLGYPPL